MTYPLLMGFISVGVVFALFVGVIPRIKTMFDSFEATLPFITRAMLFISDFLVTKWWLVLILLVLGFLRPASGSRQKRVSNNGIV